VAIFRMFADLKQESLTKGTEMTEKSNLPWRVPNLYANSEGVSFLARSSGKMISLEVWDLVYAMSYYDA
jgi:hypothetical protein